MFQTKLQNDFKVILMSISEIIKCHLNPFLGMGSMRGSSSALAQLTRGNSSSPSMSAGSFLIF